MFVSHYSLFLFYGCKPLALKPMEVRGKIREWNSIYTSLFTKMVVKRRKKYIHTKIQQTETEAEIKNNHMHNMHKD